jgi:hypothetical protein
VGPRDWRFARAFFSVGFESAGLHFLQAGFSRVAKFHSSREFLITRVDAALVARLTYTSTLRRAGVVANHVREAGMKSFFEAASVKEVKERIALLRPDSVRLWGKMNAPQAVAHCSAGLELALGDKTPPRMLVGRLIGWIVKPLALRDDEPMRRNSPTMKELIVQDERDLGPERQRLLGLIDRFAAAGPAGCTKHPHSFFGRLTPDEWAILTYKHLDHHLRQFGV